jgi:hypothetical protein
MDRRDPCFGPKCRVSGPEAKLNIQPSRKVVAHETFQRTTRF